MKTFVCIAVSCLLVGLLYIYTRQQLTAHAVQIEHLTEMVKCLVTPPNDQLAPESDLRMRESDDLRMRVSDDEESDEESEEETDDEELAKESSMRVVNMLSSPDFAMSMRVLNLATDSNGMPSFITVLKNEVDDGRVEEVVEEVEKVVEEVEKVVEEVVEEVVEKVVEEVVEEKRENYDALTIKELKAVISKMGGPSNLKTKKDMVSYLHLLNT